MSRRKDLVEVHIFVRVSVCDNSGSFTRKNIQQLYVRPIGNEEPISITRRGVVRCLPEMYLPHSIRWRR